MTEQPYKLVCPAIRLEQLRRWGKLAEAKGSHDEYLALLKYITQRLTTDPTVWGDPIRPLRGLGLEVYRGLRSWLQVLYAVDEVRRIVYVNQFIAHPDSGMAQGL
jgi:hypothetical protein